MTSNEIIYRAVRPVSAAGGIQVHMLEKVTIFEPALKLQRNLPDKPVGLKAVG